jgi:hypothetical protein
VSIWNDIGPVAWGDDPLGPQFDGDLADVRRQIAASHLAAKRAARIEGEAFAVVAALVAGAKPVVVLTYDHRAAALLVDRIVEMGHVDHETAATFVRVVPHVRVVDR